MFKFKNPFRKESTVEATMNQQDSMPPIPEKELFIDMKEPEENLKPAREESEIRKFLSKNHFLEGLAAGYEMHCHDGLQIHLKVLRSNFRDAVDRVLAGLNEELKDKQIVLTQIGSLLPSQKDCLEITIKSVQGMIEEAKLQKVLSVDDEGWISSAITAFEKGYHKGMLDYLNETNFLSQTKL